MALHFAPAASRIVFQLTAHGVESVTNGDVYILVGMLLIRSHDRAERVRAAMLCRGFRGKFYDLKDFSMRNMDYVVMFLMLIATTGIALLQWMG